MNYRKGYAELEKAMKEQLEENASLSSRMRSLEEIIATKAIENSMGNRDAIARNIENRPLVELLRDNHDFNDGVMEGIRAAVSWIRGRNV